jgi:hypothetical protein
MYAMMQAGRRSGGEDDEEADRGGDADREHGGGECDGERTSGECGVAWRDVAPSDSQRIANCNPAGPIFNGNVQPLIYLTHPYHRVPKGTTLDQQPDGSWLATLPDGKVSGPDAHGFVTITDMTMYVCTSRPEIAR